MIMQRIYTRVIRPILVTSFAKVIKLYGTQILDSKPNVVQIQIYHNGKVCVSL